MNSKIVTVFGGTGFLGRRTVRRLVENGFQVRVAARNPEAVAFDDIREHVARVAGDVRDESSVAAAIEGAQGVVNAVSLYIEDGPLTFEAIHVEAAERIARLCTEHSVGALVHVSGIGIDPDSPSRLVRSRAEGERVVRSACDVATIVRPSVMFGRGDAFVSNLEKATRAPVVPLFGRGETRQQPAWVQDVALAVTRALAEPAARGQVFELGGATVLTYREAVEAVCEALDRQRLLVPMPFAVWRGLTCAMTVLPEPPLTIDQIYLLAADNTVGTEYRNFADLDIEPCSMLDKLEHCLAGRH